MRIRTRTIAIYVGQLVLVLGALLVARECMKIAWLVPSDWRKQSPLASAHVVTILIAFAAVHVPALAASTFLYDKPFYANWKRLIIQIAWVFAATSVASSLVFLFTVVPFSANFYAWVFLLIGAVYLVTFAATGRLRTAVDATPGRELLELLVNPWFLVAVAVTLLPAVMAAAYKRNQEFSNLVNETRMRLTTRQDSVFALATAFRGSRFDQPMYMAFVPGDDEHFLVLTRPGRLLRYASRDGSEGEVLLDLTAEVNGVEREMGAYGFALHPEFNQSESPNKGFVFVWYTRDARVANHNRLTRFDISLESRAAREASRQELMDLKRSANGMHNGGTVTFGPDGFLYISIGDYSELGTAQNLGKYLCCGVLRIDVDRRGGRISAPIQKQPLDGVTQNYFIPLDNPWADRPDLLGEIWAHGFRNPFRMSVDQVTGDVWLGDVGWDRWEEQNRVRKGDNGQWDYLEGAQPTGRPKPATILGNELRPIYSYPQTALARAALGGVLYRGDRYPALTGKYVFGDNQSGTLTMLDPAKPEVATDIAQASHFGQLGITSITTGPSGEIFVTVLGSKRDANGEILKLVEAGIGKAPPSEPKVALSAQAQVEQKYTAVCSRCHGLDGRGEPEIESSGDITRPDFTSIAWQERVTDEHIARVVREGGHAVGLSLEMPSWGSFFTDEETPFLIMKIRSFRPKN
jgi:glucose/arabinose dehydrogenase